MTPPFVATIIMVCTGLSFFYQSPWPVGIALAVLVCTWGLWRNR